MTARLRAAGVGLVAALAAALVLRLVPGPWVAVPLALALLVLAPTALRLDRRLAVNLALVVGFVPVALSVPPVLGSRSGAILALAVGTGTAVGAAVVAPGRLRPRLRRRDGIVAALGGLAAIVALPLAWPGSPARALSMLSTGIDNSYHFAIFLELRLRAAGSPLLAVNADGTGFAFDDYPSWFHRLLTVLAQAGFGDPASAPTELLRYAQVQWVVYVGLAVLVTAAVLQALPDRVPRSLLVVVVAVLVSLVLGVPGAINLLQGHLSFLVAACAPAVMVLLAVPVRRPGLGLFVVLGGLVLATAAWLLLLPMAGAALVSPVVLLWRRQRPVVRWSALGAAVLAVVAAFLLFVLGPLTRGGLVAVLRDGTVPRVGLPTMLPVLVGAVIVLVVLAVRRQDLPLGGHVVVALAAAAQTLVLGGYMVSETGTLTYYFWKLGLGSLLVSTLLLAHALVSARSLATPGPDGSDGPEAVRGLRPVTATAAVLVLAAGYGAVLQTFTAPSLVWSGLTPVSLVARPGSPDTGDVDLVLRIAATTPPAQAARTRLLATRPQDMNPAHASEWFHDLSHSATRRAVSVDDGVYDLAEDRGDIGLAVRLAESTLATPDGLVVVTDPAVYDAALRAVPGAADRLILVD